MDDAENSGDPQSTKLVKQFYKSCVDVDKLEELQSDPLKLLINKYGGWPVVEGKTWNESNYDWIKSNARLKIMLDDDFLRFYIGVDYKNSAKRILFVDQAHLGLQKRDYYLENANKEILDSYLEYMTATAVQLGAAKSTAKQEMGQVLEFETALAEANVKDEELRDKNALYHPMSVKELKEKFPKIDFETWFKAAAEYGWRFKDTDQINLSGQQFLEKLPELLAKFSPRTLANYQIWHLVNGLTKFLAPSLREHYRVFRQHLIGAPKFKPRQDECVLMTMSSLELPVGAMYVKKYFSDDVKKELDEMAINVRDSMKTTIDNVEWMDVSTKESAHKKLSYMIENIAFPSPDIYNESWILRDYKKADIKPHNYLSNYVSIAISKMERLIREYSDPVNRTEWVGEVAAVNAWYIPELNKMTFPAGILQYPLYSPTAPNYFNYGRIGAVMGHEMTHGFDDQGRQYDANGNFELWWSIGTLAKFKKGAKCFVDQYGKIKDPTTGQNLNGEHTQGENIADNGGLKLAHKAYQKNKENKEAELDPRNQLMRGLGNFTSDQLFFLSYAQLWCTSTRTAALRNQIISDVHSPSTYRVNVPLQNYDEFAAAFECVKGSPMNPQEKCQLW